MARPTFSSRSGQRGTTPDPRLAVTEDPSVPDGLGLFEVDVTGAPFRLARFTVAPGHSTPVDSHAVHEIWHIAGGRGVLTYGGNRVVRIAEGDSVYLEPPRTHEVHNDGRETLVVHSMYWEAP